MKHMLQSVLDTLRQILKVAQSANSPWLTIDEGAVYVHKGRTWFRQQVRGGNVPSYDMGGVALVNREELDAWVRSHPSGACEMAQVMSKVS